MKSKIQNKMATKKRPMTSKPTAVKTVKAMKASPGLRTKKKPGVIDLS